MTHRTISFIKSGLRILAFGTVAAITASPVILGVFTTLVVAEVLGMVEEFQP